MIAALDRPALRIVQRIAPDLPAVAVDKVQIGQVLVNLMRNGTEAMAVGPGRDRTLSAARCGAGMVEIAVADTGPEPTKEVAAKPFQPFVTTKAGGLGVGLSICRRIIKAHGGRIRAAPCRPGGTAFHFTIPIARGTALTVPEQAECIMPA